MIVQVSIHLQALDRWGRWNQVTTGISNGQSEIKFTELEFARPASIAAQYDVKELFTGLIQAVIFEVNDRNLIGYPASDGYKYCCTKELVSKTKCHQDRLIVQVCTASCNGFLTHFNASASLAAHNSHYTGLCFCEDSKIQSKHDLVLPTNIKCARVHVLQRTTTWIILCSPLFASWHFFTLLFMRIVWL